MDAQELIRLVDATYTKRPIVEPTFCGGCGYNLQMLSYIGTCPECGTRYNARPHKLENIFVPTTPVFPYANIAAALFGLGLAYGLFRGVTGSGDGYRIFFGVLFAGLGVGFGIRAFLDARLYAKHRHILRRIESLYDEDDGPA